MSDEAPKTAQPVPPNGGQGQTTAMTAPAAGQIARRGALGTELESSAETAGAILAAQARAMVEARFVMALRNPRDWDDVRSKIMRAVERPGFAGHATEKVWGAAWYRKPVGEGAEGFSIRFAEEALRCMGNVDVQTITVYDDDDKRIVSVNVTDLESNLSFPTSLIVTKTVERRNLRKGEQALKVRVNSSGQNTYIVEATEDDVFQKQQNLVSKAIRNGALRLLPGDIQAEARKRILEIRHGDIAKDPDGARRKVADGFSALNVTPSMVKEYLGHDLATASPAELGDLRDLWTELKEGKTTWAEVMAEVQDERGAAQAPAPKASGLDVLTDKLKAQTTTATSETQPPAQPPPPPPPPAEPEKGVFGKAVVEEETKRRGGTQRKLEE